MTSHPEGLSTVDTPAGPAGVSLALPDAGPRGLLVLGHGAGGSTDAPDLVAVSLAAVAVGFACARVTQPYRLAGKRAPAPAARLDAAWVAVCTALADGRSGPLVVGGRSSGARVACRTVSATGAAGVLGLAFPLQPPAGRPDRGPELRDVLAAAVRLLVVQGERDPFGGPEAVRSAAPGALVVAVAGADHSFRVAGGGTPVAVAAVAAAAAGWLTGLLSPPG